LEWQINEPVECLTRDNRRQQAHDQTRYNSPLESHVLRDGEVEEQLDPRCVDDYALDQEPTYERKMISKFL
jgi:hypothetical protein